MPGTVRQIDVPPAARKLCTLSQVDYEDAFLADVPGVQDRTAEQWAPLLGASSRLGLPAQLLFKRQQQRHASGSDPRGGQP